MTRIFLEGAQSRDFVVCMVSQAGELLDAEVARAKRQGSTRSCHRIADAVLSAMTR
jgi:hypothetical protein